MWSSRKSEFVKAVLASASVMAFMPVSWYLMSDFGASGGDCVRVNDDDFAAKMPAVNAAFNLMAQLPVTGKPVLEALHKTNVEICHDPARPEAGGVYTDNRFSYKIKPGQENFIPSVVVHESFHHLQELQAGINASVLKVSTPEFIYANMLAEAGASAYQLMAGTEARNIDPSLWQMSAQRWPEAAATFRRAYDSAKDAQATEAQALQKGGQAVVEQMTTARDTTFWSSYVTQLQVNGRAHIRYNAQKGRHPMIPGSEAQLAQLFNGMTQLGGINFAPQTAAGETGAGQAKRATENFGYTFTGV